MEAIAQIKIDVEVFNKIFPKAQIEYKKQGFLNFETDLSILLNYLNNSKGQQVPSKACDEIWHNMILYTQRYPDFCNKYFGRFIHHIPNDKRCEADDCFNCSCGLTDIKNIMKACHTCGTEGPQCIAYCSKEEVKSCYTH